MTDNVAGLLKISDLIAATGGRSISSGARVALGSFTSVVTDSRRALRGSLFVPLMGKNQNGHAYIPQALEKGASVVFICRTEYESARQKYDQFSVKSNAVFIVVENTLSALQRAAASYVRQFPNLIKIGITGSSGKTTVKEITVAVLSRKFQVIMNEGNFNSETGLPLEVFKIRSHHQVGVFEMGMNRKGEIAELSSVLFPDLAVITNIGTAHIGILGTKDAIAEEKKSIFAHFSQKNAAFIPAGDAYADFLARGVSGTVVRFGKNCNPAVSNVTDCGLDGTTFLYRGGFVRFPLIGCHNFIDALAAVAVGEYLGLDAEEIRGGLESVTPLFGRSQIVRAGAVLIQDCYNANPESVESIIHFCADLSWSGRKVLVLGDMLELGEKSAALHEKIGILAAAARVDFAVFFGPQSFAAAQAYKKAGGREMIHTEDIERVQEALLSFVRAGDLVVFKASKGMELWRASEALAENVCAEKAVVI